MIFRFKLVENYLTEDENDNLNPLQKILAIDSKNEKLQKATNSESDFNKYFKDYLNELKKDDTGYGGESALSLLQLYRNENINLLKQFESDLLDIAIRNLNIHGTEKTPLFNLDYIVKLLVQNAQQDGYDPTITNSNFFTNKSISLILDYIDFLISLDEGGEVFNRIYGIVKKRQLKSDGLSILSANADKWFADVKGDADKVMRKISYFTMLYNESARNKLGIPDDIKYNTPIVKDTLNPMGFRAAKEGEKGVEIMSMPINDLDNIMSVFDQTANAETITLGQFFEKKGWDTYEEVKDNFIDAIEWLGNGNTQYEGLRQDLISKSRDKNAYSKLLKNIKVEDREDLTADEILKAYNKYLKEFDVDNSLLNELKKQDTTVVNTDSAYTPIRQIIIDNSNANNQKLLLSKFDTVWDNPQNKDKFIKLPVRYDENNKPMIAETIMTYLSNIKTQDMTGSQILQGVLGKTPTPDDMLKFVQKAFSAENAREYIADNNTDLLDLLGEMTIALTNPNNLSNVLVVDQENMFEKPIKIVGDEDIEQQLAAYVLGVLKAQFLTNLGL